MKKNIVITIIVVLALVLGFILYKVSPQPTPAAQAVEFDFSGVQQLSEPGQVRSEDHILGNPGAKNTVIAYEDIQCPACANFESTLEALPSELQDTKVIFRHFPLISIHKNAALAALATEAASAQGKFWEFTTLAYENQSEWENLSNPIDKFAAIAAAANVPNIEQFKTEVINQTHKLRVQNDLVEAASLGVQGTPTLYFNGKKLEIGGVAAIKAQAEPLYIK